MTEKDFELNVTKTRLLGAMLYAPRLLWRVFGTRKPKNIGFLFRKYIVVYFLEQKFSALKGGALTQLNFCKTNFKF